MIEHSPVHRAPVGGEYYVFRDPVHNLIEIDEDLEGRLIRRLLRTREMQRLRHIAQNGLGNYVYQGLEGSRFPHSLGTYHVARALVRSLADRQPKDPSFPESMRIQPNDLIAFPVAAMLHDLGHGPLSHIWEQCLKPPLFDGFDHEKHTRLLLTSSESDIGHYLQNGIMSEFPSLATLGEDVVSFLDGNHRLYYLSHLLHGNLDVDRLDFIARDTRNAGVTYGFHDLSWIIRSFRFARISPELIDSATFRNQFDPFWTIAIDGRKGTSTLVQFLNARENMYSLVYLHKTVRGASVLLNNLFVRAATLLKSDMPGVPVQSKAFARVLRNQLLDINQFLMLDDNTVWEQIKIWAYESDIDIVLKLLSKKLYSRDYFKVFSVNKTTYDTLRQLDREDGSLFASIFAAKSGLTVSESSSFYGFDNVSFNKVGRERAKLHDTVWIMKEGIDRHKFTSLHEFWAANGEELDVQQYYFAVDERMLAEANLIVERLSHAESSLGVPASEAPENYRVVATLGREGEWKSAYIGIPKVPGADESTVVALKSYKNAEDAPDAIERDVRQVNLLLDSVDGAECLARAREAGIRGGRTWLVEKLWSSSLLDVVRKTGPIRDIREFARLGLDLATGLGALHSAGLRHTDIKLDNCGVLRAQGKVERYVLGDFGCISPRQNEPPINPRLQGTIRTRAPEVFTGTEFSLAGDVWGLGATLYAACVGEYPFMQLDSKHLEDDERRAAEQKMADEMPQLLAEFRAKREQKLPPIILELLSGCFEERRNRTSATALRSSFSNFLQNLDSFAPGPQAEAKGAWQRAQDMLVQRNVTGQPLSDHDLEAVLGSSGARYVPPELLSHLRQSP